MHFLAGLILAFLSYLPPGNLNLTVIQMSAVRRKRDLISFIGAVAFVEFVYSFIAIKSMEWLTEQTTLFLWLNYLMVPFFLVLAIYIFLKKEEHPHAQPIPAKSFLKGLLLAGVNPIQIPFWLIWGLWLLKYNFVSKETTALLVFSLGTVAGTFLSLGTFAYAGKKLFEKLDVNQKWLNRGIGIFFVILALFQLYSVLHGHGIQKEVDPPFAPHIK
jgi:threonine/homoserine/homoserine lactone efflux protein